MRVVERDRRNDPVGEVKHNVWLDPVPAFVKGAPLVFVVTWRAPVENHDKIVQWCADGMNVQRQIPSQVSYSRTRTWFRPSDDGQTEEWWFMDEYDSVQAFEAMQKLMAPRFTGGVGSEQTAQSHSKLLDLLVPGSDMTPVLYSESSGSRIEFESFTARAAVITQQFNSTAQ